MPKVTSLYPGFKKDRLRLIERAGNLNKHPRRTLWKCLCDCGNEVIVDSGNLKKSSYKSCGCLKAELARLKGKKKRTEESYLNYLYGECKRSAKFRKYKFELSKEDFRYFITKNCFYCNSEPVLRKSNIGIPFPVNGIDRLANTMGYFVGNCVSCCELCNKMKNVLTADGFIDHCIKIARFNT